MSKKTSVKLMVEGGAATTGPPLGPALGPLGVNAAKVVEEINKVTGAFRGMRIPVEVLVDPGTKQFEVVVGSPPTSALLIKALGQEKGGGGKDYIGDLALDQVMEVAKNKQQGILAKDMKASVKEMVGSCQSLRITIQGLTPKEMTEAISKGVLDDYLSGKTKDMPKLEHKEAKAVKLLGHIEEAKKEKAPTAEATAPEAGAPAQAGEKKPEGKADEKKPAEDKKPAADRKEKK